MKKVFFKALVAFVLAIAISNVTFAQTAERKWGLGGNLGVRDTHTDSGNEIVFKGWDNPYVVAGAYLSRYLNPSFDASLNINGGMLAFKQQDGPYGRFTAKAVDFSVMGKYKFNNGYILKENAAIAPYLTAGIGAYQAWDIVNADFFVPRTSQIDHMTVFDIPVGAGIRFNVTEKVNLNLQSIYHIGFSDELDNIKSGSNDAWLHTSVGIGFNLGKAKIKDEDSDGVADKDDKCPGTRPSFKVDLSGCDLDTDKDGVADTEDNCPEKAGAAKMYGCPDGDKDGIADNRDRCPGEAGIASLDGCPDTDADGIKDSEDKCPKIAGIAEFEGCPDTDGDGLQDAGDKCPQAAGKVEFGGCPDTDGDGLGDADDKCPALAGTAEDGGCPKVNQAVKKQIEQAASHIYFETGKDILKKESNAGLDKIVALLDADKDLKVDIEGHTDNVGDALKNKELSDARAAAVKNYFAAKGIDAARITSAGYGSEKPVADNKTAAGKAQNRRVELKLKY